MWIIYFQFNHFCKHWNEVVILQRITSECLNLNLRCCWWCDRSHIILLKSGDTSEDFVLLLPSVFTCSCLIDLPLQPYLSLWSFFISVTYSSRMPTCLQCSFFTWAGTAEFSSSPWSFFFGFNGILSSISS